MTNAVLGETERAWLLIFAMLALTLSLAQVGHAAVISVLFGAATAFAYGLLGDFSDLLFGFLGTAVGVTRGGKRPHRDRADLHSRGDQQR